MAIFEGDAESVDLRDESSPGGEYWYTDVQFILKGDTVGAGRVVFIRTGCRPPLFEGRPVIVDGKLTSDRSRVYANSVSIPGLNFVIETLKRGSLSFFEEHFAKFIIMILIMAAILFAFMMITLVRDGP